MAAGPVPWRARPQNLSLDRHQAKAAMHTRARTTWNILLTLVRDFFVYERRQKKCTPPCVDTCLRPSCV